MERNVYQRAATPCLKDASRILDTLGLDWWCEAGTCLGIVRDKDFIAHDSDIDIGLIEWERWQELEKALIADDFHQLHTFGTPENGLEMSFSKHGVKIDFFFFYPKGERLWHSAWKDGEQLFLEFKAKYILPTKRTEFLGFEVNLPNDTDSYLQSRYGDWHIINKDWDWSKDPLCIRK